MAKKKDTEKKFRWVRLALSNHAYANLEHLAKFLKISKSSVVTKLLKPSPMALLEKLQAQLEADALRIRSRPSELGHHPKKLGDNFSKETQAELDADAYFLGDKNGE